MDTTIDSKRVTLHRAKVEAPCQLVAQTAKYCNLDSFHISSLQSPPQLHFTPTTMADPTTTTNAKELWHHSSPESTQLHSFLQTVNKAHNKSFKTYLDLYTWSITDLPSFWAAVWDAVGIRASTPYETVIENNGNGNLFPRPAWFSGSRLNFAENLLFPVLPGGAQVKPNSVAVIAATETTREEVTWEKLRERVRKCRSGLKALGVGPNDRVAGYVGNHTNALVAMLAATALGAVWTAVSPDTGVTAVVERLVQIEPKVLFADNAVGYNGKVHRVLEKVGEVVARLESLKGTVVFETLDGVGVDVGAGGEGRGVVSYGDFVDGKEVELVFEQLPADHPVYILYSSGTTGAPKCIVHGAIGTLLQHKKEHILQSDIRVGDRLFYFTTCTWMMWHWLVSGLASGATLILYDGSPFQYLQNGQSVKDDLAMPRLIEELSITQFGTSAKYLSILEQKSLFPKEGGPAALKLSTLKAIYSTGSPLAPSTFSYVYRAFGPDLNLASITGGTDIISLFGAPSPLSPVYEGEIQVLGLGMAVQAWDYTGKNVSATGEPGDLVCVKPFPCQPVTFWGPTGEGKYRSSYFELFGPEVWHHGDFVRFNPTTGGLYMLGRSDGILKPSGVRFGSAEIYNILLKSFPDSIEDALCIGRRRETDTDETVVLFLKMKEGVSFGEKLSDDIKSTVRKELSARHVPGVIDECPEIPVTVNGKK
jgi:acetoacetyl-CoA synthetase